MSKPEFDLLIKNTRVVRPHGNVVFDADIAIADGKVALVAPGIDVARAKAVHDGKHRMALVFRAYLGLSSRWAIDDLDERAVDFQVWCGPAMGAFNSWVRGSFLEATANRTVVQVALNLLEGAAVITRAQQLRSYGLPISAAAFDFRPRPLA